MVEGLQDIKGVTFNDLYQEYPELDIDIKREQELLEKHDVIIFQFPFFWYSTPAILKEWEDLVLEHGWAFGSKGNALKDKLFMCSMTVGGPRSAYRIGDFHNHTINQLLSPLRQTAILCKMQPLPPFVVHGSHSIKKEEVIEHRGQLHQLLDLMINNQFNKADVEGNEYMNDYLSKL